VDARFARLCVAEFTTESATMSDFRAERRVAIGTKAVAK
jgi:hypothetical protein